MKKWPKLDYWVKKYSLEYWGQEVDVPVKWSKRLKSNWGICKYKRKSFKPIEICISPNVVFSDRGNFHGTLKHELCHYFLLKDGINHGEYDEIFLKELRRVGGNMPTKLMRVDWYCKECGKFLFSTKSKSFSSGKFAKHMCCGYKVYGKTFYEKLK